MALIGVEQIKKVTITVPTEKSVATPIDKSAAFIHARADDANNKTNTRGSAMPKLPANPAVLPQPHPRKTTQASESLSTVNGKARMQSLCVVLDGSKVAAIAANFLRRDAEEILDLGCVCRIASRRLFGHCVGGLPRPAATRSSASAAPPCGLRFPSKSYSASTPKRFVRTLRKCRASALGSRPHSQGSARCDPNKIGKFNKRRHYHVPEQSQPHRLPRQRCRSVNRKQQQLHHVLAGYEVLLQRQEDQPVCLAYRVAPLRCLRQTLRVRQDADQGRTSTGRRRAAQPGIYQQEDGH